MQSKKGTYKSIKHAGTVLLPSSLHMRCSTMVPEAVWASNQTADPWHTYYKLCLNERSLLITAWAPAEPLINEMSCPVVAEWLSSGFRFDEEEGFERWNYMWVQDKRHGPVICQSLQMSWRIVCWKEDIEWGKAIGPHHTAKVCNRLLLTNPSPDSKQLTYKNY